MAAQNRITARRLIALTALITAVAAGFIGWRVSEPYRLKREVRRLGGHLEFRDHSGAPLLLRPFFKSQQSTELGLSDLAVGDEWLVAHPELAGFPQLSIYLSRTLVTDEGLKRLGTMPEITHLLLEDTAVTDAGLAEIGRLPNLVSLNLGGT